MASFFNQLHQAGGALHVAVLQDDNLLVFAMVEHKRARHAGPQADPDDNFPMSPDMSVGMVLDYLILRDRPLIFHEASPQVSVELVENPAAESTSKPTPCNSHTASGRVAANRRMR
jgi:hypothetical protein